MSRKTRKKLTVTVAVILALLILLPLVLTVISAGARATKSEDELEALKNEAAYLEQQQENVQNRIAQNEAEQASTIEKKTAVDEQIQLTEAEIVNANKQLQQYNVLIAEKQAELDAVIEEEELLMDHFRRRMRIIEENGEVSYWSIIFGANSFADLLDRIVMVNELVSSNQQVMERVTQARADVAAQQAVLEDCKEEQKSVKDSLAELQADLEAQRAAADQLILDLIREEAELEEYYRELEAARAQVAEDIDKKIAQIEEEERLAKLRGTTTGYVYGTGTYIWPVSAVTLTSPFGWRMHPTLGYEKFHSGVDIGAYSGDPIWAADSGTVIVSGYNEGGYGNYVVIAHGDGYTTLYGHMSSRAVSEGDVVAKGQTIGYVGSTGRSTGPHLHFEIRCNGEYLDPLGFFDTSGFIIAY